MIATLMRIARINLMRDRVAQAMTFVLPITFFSIFALVFGGQNMNSTSRIRVAIVDEDRSETSRRLVAALRADPGLRARDSVRAEGADPKAPTAPIDRARAEALVSGGDYPVAIVLPRGFGATFPDITGTGPRVDVLADVSDPVASHLAVGLLQRAAGRMLQDSLGDGASRAAGAGAGMLVPARVIDVLGERKRERGRMVSFYAAGVAVMFLLFSASAVGGSLLEEQDSGTLERVLGTRVGMTGLLAGKWLHVTQLGVLQITVMFVWGAAVFGLDLLGHLPGFAVMTLVTAAAASAFGLVLATACRTRAQLSGIATILILVMSALGGSMFPRFLMSDAMQRVGLATFNAWSLDGYVKVFWRDASLPSLAPQVGVLLGFTVVFLALARLLARRWETE